MSLSQHRHLPRLSNKLQILHLFVGSLAMALIAPFTQPGVAFQFACKSICLNESSLSHFLKLGKQASIIKPRTTFLEAEAFNALNTRQFSPQLLKRPCQIKSHWFLSIFAWNSTISGSRFLVPRPIYLGLIFTSWPLWCDKSWVFHHHNLSASIARLLPRTPWFMQYLSPLPHGRKK